ncbi:GDSL/SGNH-like acyl-esterase family found in Pmr5 and Cas1p-domain-containing protein [Polychytrium aggregatum]|uniref:GDSL/SGNH-like acyl-esterase family found in Pmr5 and Cas1p-domain-containing protein n=1 Tax=Polychytrium aggregatum TaxID=110093 RepID=UPI0022FEA6F9|nr:GDSL/SGNH-like acyl-esterase family found in Pmr5 and Cas1p-domain-containing protein [Polychytrium aggregatum]KAI9208682.1 GDSL/SGNH-like acyl-esterase family found in Pmr5 and Cas1p-domain-containing protein [Polychytrium aggregatum]
MDASIALEEKYLGSAAEAAVPLIASGDSHDDLPRRRYPIVSALVLSVLLLIAGLQSILGPRPMDPSVGCDQSLGDGNWVFLSDFKGPAWQPKGCSVHYYGARDAHACFNNTRIALYGDSTMRLFYYALRYRLTGNATRGADRHASQRFSVDANTSVEFFWDPFLNSSDIVSELSGSRVRAHRRTSALVFSAGMWFMKNANDTENGKTRFRTQLRAIQNGVEYSPVPLADKAIFRYLTPLVNHKLSEHRRRKMRSGFVDEYNQIIDDMLASRSPQRSRLATSRSMHNLYESALEYAYDGLHFSAEIVDNEVDMFLNWLCNPTMPNLTATCCTPRPQVRWSQWLPIGLSLVSCLGAWVLTFHRSAASSRLRSPSYALAWRLLVTMLTLALILVVSYYRSFSQVNVMANAAVGTVSLLIAGAFLLWVVMFCKPVGQPYPMLRQLEGAFALLVLLDFYFNHESHPDVHTLSHIVFSAFILLRFHNLTLYQLSSRLTHRKQIAAAWIVAALSTMLITSIVLRVSVFTYSVPILVIGLEFLGLCMAFDASISSSWLAAKVFFLVSTLTLMAVNSSMLANTGLLQPSAKLGVETLALLLSANIFTPVLGVALGSYHYQVSTLPPSSVYTPKYPILEFITSSFILIVWLALSALLPSDQFWPAHLVVSPLGLVALFYFMTVTLPRWGIHGIQTTANGFFETVHSGLSWVQSRSLVMLVLQYHLLRGSDGDSVLAVLPTRLLEIVSKPVFLVFNGLFLLALLCVISENVYQLGLTLVSWLFGSANASDDRPSS